jgi:hypothetical protein
MNRRLLIFTVSLVLLGLLTACAPTQWSAYGSFFGQFEEISNVGDNLESSVSQVKELMTGYNAKVVTEGNAALCHFRNVSVGGVRWEEAVITPVSNNGITVGLKQTFEDEKSCDEFYEKVANQLTDEYGEQSWTDYGKVLTYSGEAGNAPETLGKSVKSDGSFEVLLMGRLLKESE